jgi:hypothetical protein
MYSDGNSMSEIGNRSSSNNNMSEINDEDDSIIPPNSIFNLQAQAQAQAHAQAQEHGSPYYPSPPTLAHTTEEPHLIKEIAADVDAINGPSVRRTWSNKVSHQLGDETIIIFVKVITKIASDFEETASDSPNMIAKVFQEVIDRIEKPRIKNPRHFEYIPLDEIRQFFEPTDGITLSEYIKNEILNALKANYYAVLDLDQFFIAHGTKVTRDYLVWWSHRLYGLSQLQKVLLLYYIHEYAREYYIHEYAREYEYQDNEHVKIFMHMIRDNIRRLITKPSSITFNYTGLNYEPVYPFFPEGFSNAQSLLPPAQSGLPPAQSGFSPAQSGLPPAPYGLPPAQYGLPPGQSVSLPAQSGFSQAPPGFPPAQSVFPQGPQVLSNTQYVLPVAIHNSENSDDTTGFVGSLLKYDEELQNYHLLPSAASVTDILTTYGVEGIKFSDVCVGLFSTENRDGISKRNKFLQIAFMYSAIHDYIDMVHDTTKCSDHLLEIFKNLRATKVTFYDQTFNLDQETITGIIAELTEINKVMCSVSKNIIISESHILQSKYFDKFIHELKGIGIPMPALSHETNIRKNEVDKFIAEQIGLTLPLHVTRESGPNIDKYLTQDQQQMIVKVPQNNLGAIDGCKGECRLTADQIEWNHNIAGCCQIKIKSRTESDRKTTITVSLFGDASKQMTFEVTEEITLNDVMVLMDETALRGNGNVRNNIVIKPGSQSHGLRGEERKVMIMSLKTICDQRILQIMKTTHNGSIGQQLWCVTTVDSYVALVNLIKFIIMVGIDCFEEKKLYLLDFPKIFLTAGDFFRIREYSLNPNTEYFKKMMAILVNSAAVTFFLDATTKFIEESQDFRDYSSSAIPFPDKILEYFRMRLFFTYTTVWEKKKKEWMTVYKKALADFDDLVLEVQGTPTLTEILLTLSSPPSLTDVYVSIQEKMDSNEYVCNSLFETPIVDWTEKFKIEGDFIIIRDHDNIVELIKAGYISKEMDDIFETGTDGKEFLKIPITIELLLKLSLKLSRKRRIDGIRGPLPPTENDVAIPSLLIKKINILLNGGDRDPSAPLVKAFKTVIDTSKEDEDKQNISVLFSGIDFPKQVTLAPQDESESTVHAIKKKKRNRTSSAKKSTSRTSSAKKSTSRTSSAKKSRKSSSPKKKTPRSKDVTPRSKDVTPLLFNKNPHIRPGPSGARGSSNSRPRTSTNRGGARRTYKKQKKYF